MKKMKKWLSVVTAITMVVGSMSGCGQQEMENKTSEGNIKNESEPEKNNEEMTELTICTVSKPFIEDLATNEFTKYIEEQTGIHINWITVPLNNLQEKVQLILSSGELPDVFMSVQFSSASLTKYGVDEGLLIPLDEYIEKDAPNLQKVLEDYPIPNALDTMRMSDGKIYSMPVLDICDHSELPAKMWVYDPWMQELGLEYPETTEEFEEMLRAFKTQDPNGNGVADELPLIASTDGGHGQIDSFLLNSFVYYDSVNYGMYLEDGKIENCLAQEEYKQGLQWLNKLYQEGLIYENSLTQTKDVSRNLSGGEIPLVGAAPGLTSGTEISATRKHDFRPIAPLEGPNGVRQAPTFTSFPQNGQYVVTSACENVEAAIKLADFMYQDIPSLWTRVGGPEGESWVKAEEGDVGFDGEPSEITVIKPWSTAEVQNKSWLDIGVWNYTDLRVKQTVPEDINMWSDEGLEYMLYAKTMELYEPYAVDKQVPPLAIATEDADRTAQLTTDLEKLMDASQFNFITGAYNFESDWENYVKEVNNLVEPLKEIYQKTYDANYKGK